MTLKEKYEQQNLECGSCVPTKKEIEEWQKNRVEHKYVHFVKADTNFEEGYKRALALLDDYKSGKIRAIPGELEEYIEYVNSYLSKPRVAECVVDFIKYVESNHLENVVIDELEEDSWDEFKKAVEDGYYRLI